MMAVTNCVVGDATNNDARDLAWSNVLADVGVAMLEAEFYREAIAAWKLADVIARGLTINETLRRCFVNTLADMNAALMAECDEYLWIETMP